MVNGFPEEIVVVAAAARHFRSSIRALRRPPVASGWFLANLNPSLRSSFPQEVSMNPLSFVFSPITDVTRAIVMPFKALFVVGLTGTINAMTYHGVWWFKWVALGMGIAVLVSFAKAARTLLLLALVAYVGRKLYQRYGQEARNRFDDWVSKTQPQAAQVVAALRAPPTTPASDTASRA
jgi:hypothetical protein